MSKYSKLATLSVAVFVGLLVAYLGGYQAAKTTDSSTVSAAKVAPNPETPVLAQNIQPQMSGEQSAAEVAAIDPEDVDPADIDWEAMKARYDSAGYDPMLLRWSHLDFTPEEIAAFNKLHVLPFNKKVGETCGPTTIYDEHVGQIDSYGCVPVLERAEHPYAKLPTQQLKDLAETDAEAAVFAGRRAEGREAKIQFALRAAALSGKSGPIMEVANRFSGIGPERVLANRQLDIADELIKRVILEKVALALGDPRANPDKWKNHLDEFAKTQDVKDAVLTAIDERTRKTLSDIIEIERATTGSAVVWEKLNA